MHRRYPSPDPVFDDSEGSDFSNAFIEQFLVGRVVPRQLINLEPDGVVLGQGPPAVRARRAAVGLPPTPRENSYPIPKTSNCSPRRSIKPFVLMSNLFAHLVPGGVILGQGPPAVHARRAAPVRAHRAAVAVGPDVPKNPYTIPRKSSPRIKITGPIIANKLAPCADLVVPSLPSARFLSPWLDRVQTWTRSHSGLRTS